MSKKLYGMVLLGCGLPLIALADIQLTPDMTIGSVMFFDFSPISDQQNVTDVAPTGTGIDVKRFHLSFDHRFNNIWSANLTTDAQYISSPSVTLPGTLPAKATTTSTTNSRAVSEVFIKKLYLQAKFNDAFVLSAGSISMPWASLAEGLYAYRWVEKTTEDGQGFLNTTDWGLHATGTFSDTGIKYAVSVVNGNGFKNPSRSKYVDFEGQVNGTAPIGITVGVGGYSGHLGQINAANENYPRNNATRFNAIIGYQFAGLRVGGDYSWQRTTKPSTPPKPEFMALPRWWLPRPSAWCRATRPAEDRRGLQAAQAAGRGPRVQIRESRQRSDHCQRGGCQRFVLNRRSELIQKSLITK